MTFRHKRRIAHTFDIIAFAGLSALALCAAACDLPGSDSASALDQSSAGPPIAQTKEDWHAAMRELALPARGCFNSDFPRVEWRQVPCAVPPDHPYPPVRGRRPQTVGSGTDWAAKVSSGLISAAEGSFDAVAGVTTIDSTATGGVSEFSLQLNTQFFITPACGGSPNPGCRGWEQFVYSNTGLAYIQYWLIQYNTACPAGWNTAMFGSDTYCWKNAPNGVLVGHQPVANLINMKLGGSAVMGGLDTVSIDPGGGSMSATNADAELTLAAAWTDAEFNIFGDCCGSDATFNPGSSVTVRTTVHNGTTNAPSCQMEGFTGETNSLTLVGTPALMGSSPSPGIVFNQTNTAPFSAASCASANGIGDTHNTTVRGLYYDFQAAGDFVLAQTGPDFLVQTRQASGAPTWPNAAVNKAVATRMGTTTVAVCLGPTRLEINGQSASIADGQTIGLPDGVDLARQGDVYLVTGPHGDSVRAELHGAYINVNVGIGQWPATVQGLLGSGRAANETMARDGTIFTEPVSFADRYLKFGDSWRVPPSESLLCQDRQVEISNPRAPFCVTDLVPAAREHAQSVCQQAGVKPGPLLDACMLDVTVLGDDRATAAFVNAPPPVVVGNNGCR
jgi:hypothetical protein